MLLIILVPHPAAVRYTLEFEPDYYTFSSFGHSSFRQQIILSWLLSSSSHIEYLLWRCSLFCWNTFSKGVLKLCLCIVWLLRPFVPENILISFSHFNESSARYKGLDSIFFLILWKYYSSVAIKMVDVTNSCSFIDDLLLSLWDCFLSFHPRMSVSIFSLLLFGTQ